MKNSNPLLNQIEQKIAQSQNNSLTEAGPHKEELSPQAREQLIDTINQSFELLRLNYHHLYFSAYSEMDALNSAKRLWLESLDLFEPKTILAAVHSLIRSSDYLPTISQVIRLCQQHQFLSLPDAHSAYTEACRAPSPKVEYDWSHPIVYYAGQKSDWFFLANNDEKTAFPVFRTHYQALCQSVMRGETLPEIQKTDNKKIEVQALSKEDNQNKMASLRKELEI